MAPPPFLRLTEKNAYPSKFLRSFGYMEKRRRQFSCGRGKVSVKSTVSAESQNVVSTWNDLRNESCTLSIYLILMGDAMIRWPSVWIRKLKNMINTLEYVMIEEGKYLEIKRILSCGAVRDGYAIRTIRKLAAYKYFRTILGSTHVLNKGGHGVRSPVDGL